LNNFLLFSSNLVLFLEKPRIFRNKIFDIPLVRKWSDFVMPRTSHATAVNRPDTELTVVVWAEAPAVEGNRWAATEEVEAMAVDTEEAAGADSVAVVDTAIKAATPAKISDVRDGKRSI
jgi:hypothetical protein